MTSDIITFGKTCLPRDQTKTPKIIRSLDDLGLNFLTSSISCFVFLSHKLSKILGSCLGTSNSLAPYSQRMLPCSSTSQLANIESVWNLPQLLRFLAGAGTVLSCRSHGTNWARQPLRDLGDVSSWSVC